MAISQNLEKRAIYFGLIIILIFIVLILRLADLQLVQGDKFLEMAESNRINSQTIKAPRGNIYTTDGNILVSNKVAYSASVRSKALSSEDNVTKIIEDLSDFLNMDQQEIINILINKFIDGKVILIDELTDDVKLLIKKNESKLPGLTIEKEVDEAGNLLKEYLQVNLRKISVDNLQLSCKNLATLLPIKYDELLIKIIANGLTDQSTLMIKRNLTQEEMVVLEENLKDLPGVMIERITIRDYVYNSLAAHVLGYTKAINADELKKRAELGYRGDDFIGKTGLELYYEDFLRGTNGQEEIEVDSKNRKVRTLGVSEPEPGSDIYINIDLDLQKKIEVLLETSLTQLVEEVRNDPELIAEPKGGAIIVMNPENGKILAMTSKPDFDLNLFATGITNKDWNSLTHNPKEPFTDRALSKYPPGSIFKLVSAATFLEVGIVDEETTLDDIDGTYRIGEWEYKNWAWKHGGYGPLNIREAIAHSNNIYFYTAAHQLYNEGKGGSSLSEFARNFGLGELTGIDLPSEVKGLVPDKKWKKETRGTIWVPGNELHFSIGQGFLETSPIQLINYIAAIANGGKIFRPYLVDRIVNYQGEIVKQFEPEVIGRLPVSDKTLNVLKDGMLGVTTFGTARKAFADLPIKVAGKTGTAQTTSEYANHGWFAGFAPLNDPEIAILVFIEQGGSSSKTLPIVQEILKFYFNIPDPVVEEENVEEKLPETESGAEIDSDEETDKIINAPNTAGAANPDTESESTDSDNLEDQSNEEENFSDKLKKFFEEVFSG